MKKKCYVQLVLIFLLGCFSLKAQEMLDYEHLSALPIRQLYEEGEGFRKQNRLDTAMGYYTVLTGKYTDQLNESDKYFCALACAAVGEIYFGKEIYPQAFDFYFKGLQIAEDCGFEKIISRFYKNIGNIYSVFNDHNFAIEYYQKGLESARRNKDVDMEIKLLINLIGICTTIDRMKDVEKYYGELMHYADRDTLIEYFGYMSNALLLQYHQKNDQAAVFFQKAADYARRTCLQPRYIASAYLEKANLYEKIGLTDSALYYYKLNFDYSQENHLLYLQIQNVKALSRIYEKKGDWQQVEYCRSEYIDLTDSVLNIAEFNKMKNAQITYEMNKNYKKIASLTSEKELQHNQIRQQRILLVVICICLFVFVLLLLFVNRQKLKLQLAYKDLFHRNSEILQSEEDNRRLRCWYEDRLREMELKCKALETNVSLENTAEDISVADQCNTENESTGSRIYSSNKLSDELKNNILQRIVHIMEDTEEFCDYDFSLERLAGLVGSNSRYVSQIINETYNKNFRTFINEYRVKEARKRLMDTASYGNLTIKAIGESVGYKSQASFIDSFRKITGITPSIYQKIAKEESETSF